ncbi:hypothetical protein F0562_022555 [Nyssa sinensis]|uniref:Uncharacterized protein n=1 Tax=Nyssa sinensis TaxID=561372 RepID=A0A5J5BPH6_9ASTE|nr:hypothetical protein F0562_022555 [Nyssa sinensis]
MEGKEGSSSCSAPTAAVAHGSSRTQYVRGGQVLRLIKNREGILIRLGVVWRCRLGISNRGSSYACMAAIGVAIEAMRQGYMYVRDCVAVADFDQCLHQEFLAPTRTVGLVQTIYGCYGLVGFLCFCHLQLRTEMDQGLVCAAALVAILPRLHLEVSE